MTRGRPAGSLIRHNIMSVLAAADKPLYGYLIHKLYVQLFLPCTREVIYYHLRTGVKREEFIVTEIKKEQGDFSWGSVVEKRYFGLGKNAKPAPLTQEVQEKLQKLLKEYEL